ncbi:MAG: hypothetical protein AAGC44_03455 [Planctomycetota bacterium]
MDSFQETFLLYAMQDQGLLFWLWDDQWHLVEAASINPETLNRSSAGLVCYPNGEVICKFGQIYKLPPGVSYLIEPRKNDDKLRYTKRLVRNGEKGALVIHSPPRTQTSESSYSTTITNQSRNKIRVTKFGPFAKGLFGIKKDPVEGYYDSIQFCNWFRVSDPEGWINPGESVCDPDNYGSGDGVWVYFFENEFGDRFISTAPLTFKQKP